MFCHKEDACQNLNLYLYNEIILAHGIFLNVGQKLRQGKVT